MPVEVLMPALSPTMEKGNLSKWMKSEGDKVKAGDVIAEIETDKATMEVEAVDEGTLGKIRSGRHRRRRGEHADRHDPRRGRGCCCAQGRRQTRDRRRRKTRIRTEGGRRELVTPAMTAEDPAVRGARQPAPPASALMSPPQPASLPEPDVPVELEWSP